MKINNLFFWGGLILILLGATVISGWVLHRLPLIQVMPYFTPMVFNTALGFIISGLGIICAYKYPKLSTVLGLFLIIFSMMTLSQYIFSINIGIDELFFKSYLNTGTIFPGRPGLNTSLCFLFIGFILVLGEYSANISLMTSITLCLLIIAISLVALIGYAFGISSAYGWGEWTKMALHTAIGMLIAGLSLLHIMFFAKLKFHKQHFKYLAMGVFVFLSMCILIFWQALIKHEHDKAIDSLKEYYQQNSIQFFKTLNSDILSIVRMKDRLKRTPNMPYFFWKQDAEEYINDMPSIDIFAVISLPKLKIESYVINKRNNQSSLNHAINCVLQKNSAGNHSYNYFFLNNNQQKLCLLYNVKINQKDAYLVSIMDINSFAYLFEKRRLLKGYEIALLNNGQIIYSTNTDNLSLKNNWQVKNQINLENLSFEMVGWPNLHLMNKLVSEFSDYIILIGIIFSTLLSLLVWATQNAIENKNKILLNEKRFQDILEATPDAMVIIDESGKIIFVNEQMVQLFGYEKNELIGSLIEKLIPERFSGRHPENRQNSFINSHVSPMGHGMSLFGVRKNGDKFPVEISLSPFETKDGTVELAAVRDITERKKIDNLKNEFISVVSHELRTPLTSIHGAIVLLTSNVAGKQTPESLELLTIALRNSERLIRLINDILDLEKMEAGKMEFINQPYLIDDLINEAIANNEPYANKFSVKINSYESTMLPITVMVDHDKMIQALTNLISNAIKFSPVNGVVTISTSVKNNYVTIGVADNGKGIPIQFQSLIFQKFLQADSSSIRKHQGTGLGLSITKLIIETMGGQIHFKTKAHVGTTFYLTLPICKEYDPTNINLSKQSTQFKILHVENDFDLYSMVEAILKDEYMVFYASSIESAKKQLATNLFHLVILDLKLNDGSALELIPELNKKKIPIIILTAYELPKEYLTYVNHVLIKSKISNQQIKETVQAVLQSTLIEETTDDK